MAETALAPTLKELPRGRDELNLIDFPISTLQYQQPTDSEGKLPDELVCIVHSFDTDLGKIVPRKLIRRTASRHGFPTPLEDEVIIALLTLTRIKNEFSSPRIEFRNAEMFDLMGWPHNGTSTARLSVALDRLTGLTLKYENSWTTEDGTFQKEFTTGLLESYKFTRQTRGRRSRDTERNWVQWASEVFSDIQKGNVKQLNTDEFFSLKRPITRRLYRFLDKHLASNQQFEMDLGTFAAHLGLSETSHIGKIKERLLPGLRELETLPHFIAPVEPAQRFRKRGPGDWTIQVERPIKRDIAEKTGPGTQVRVGTDGAAVLVQQFYRQWNGTQRHLPTAREMQQAETVVANHGTETAKAILPEVIALMRQQFPDARAFGATMLFWSDAQTRLHRRSDRAEREAAQSNRDRLEVRQRSRQAGRRAELQKLWDQLPVHDQDDIRNRVAQTACMSVRQFLAKGKSDDPLVLLACFEEMERRRTS